MSSGEEGGRGEGKEAEEETSSTKYHWLWRQGGKERRLGGRKDSTVYKSLNLLHYPTLTHPKRQPQPLPAWCCISEEAA